MFEPPNLFTQQQQNNIYMRTAEPVPAFPNDSTQTLKGDATWGIGGGGGGAPVALSFGAINLAVSNTLYPKAYAISMAAPGNVDLYTVPVGRLALVIDCLITNPTGNTGAVTCMGAVKTGGLYHTFDFICNNMAAGNNGRSQSLAPFLLRAGESFAVNTNRAGCSVWASIIEFDATANINDARLFALNAGDNTLFTVPANKTIQLIGFPSALNLGQSGWVWYWNNTLAIRNINMHVVPSGGAPSNNNKINGVTVCNDLQMVQQQFYGGLSPGDFININTDSNIATQTAWVIYTQQ